MPRRTWLGVTPSRLRINSVMCDWLEKPHDAAMAAIDRARSCRSAATAASMRSAST